VKVALVNYFHSGDVILSRALIRRVRPLLIDRVALELRCAAKNTYLWKDLGLPLHVGPPTDPDVHCIDMWFGAGGDLLGVSGLTHATQVTSYNRQAEALGLPTLDPEEPVPSIDFPPATVRATPGVLVENGPVLSGQDTHELNPLLSNLAKMFNQVRFYCTGPVQQHQQNIIDCSKQNLIEISALSECCFAMLARLSGPFVATLTSRNVGRLRRLVYGSPIGCPIWDERDVEYYTDFESVVERLKGLVP